MSERKSWDVQPNPRKRAPEPAPAPVRAPARQPRVPSARPATRPAPRPQPASARPAPRRTAPPSGTLRERRTKRRRASQYVLIGVVVLLIGAFFYLVWRPAFRIQQASAQGPGAGAAKQIVMSKLEGTYLYIIPRNSTFFYPQTRMRAAILDAVPEASAVSLKRDSFSSLAILTVPRQESFLWCGTSIDTPNTDGTCYEADVLGYVFKQADDTIPVVEASSTASSTAPSAKEVRGQIRVFGALDADLKEGQSPIRLHVASADKMADALIFVNAIRSLGAPVRSLAIRGDEADVWLSASTRITYVLGHEKEAADTAASALPTLTLTDGSIQYVDLRFPGKAYVKRYGE